MNELREILKLYQELGAEFLQSVLPDPRRGLQEINQEILHCRACGLHQTKTHYVPGEGSWQPPIMFIGEGPGETEDKFGRPFIGKAGQLLDRIIEKMGYRRQDVFIGNIVKCRPPNNREPMPDEVAACLPFLQKQIELLTPRVIVCLGKVALNNLLGTNHAITRIRGHLFSYGQLPVIATYHPAYILHKKNPQEISRAKWEVWDDMQKVLTVIGKGQIAG